MEKIKEIVEEKEIPPTTPTINPEVRKSMPTSPEEGLDLSKSKTKEDPKINEIKQTKLKEKILNFFKMKTLSEIENPVKIREMLRRDMEDLNNLQMYGTGSGGASFNNVGLKYEDLMKKYNIETEAKNIVEEMKNLKKKQAELKDNEQRIDIQRQIIAKHGEFMQALNKSVEERIDALELKEAA